MLIECIKSNQWAPAVETWLQTGAKTIVFLMGTMPPPGSIQNLMQSMIPFFAYNEKNCFFALVVISEFRFDATMWVAKFTASYPNTNVIVSKCYNIQMTNELSLRENELQNCMRHLYFLMECQIQIHGSCPQIERICTYPRVLMRWCEECNLTVKRFDTISRILPNPYFMGKASFTRHTQVIWDEPWKYPEFENFSQKAAVQMHRFVGSRNVVCIHLAGSVNLSAVVGCLDVSFVGPIRSFAWYDLVKTTPNFWCGILLEFQLPVSPLHIWRSIVRKNIASVVSLPYAHDTFEGGLINIANCLVRPRISKCRVKQFISPEVMNQFLELTSCQLPADVRINALVPRIRKAPFNVAKTLAPNSIPSSQVEEIEEPEPEKSQTCPAPQVLPDVAPDVPGEAASAFSAEIAELTQRAIEGLLSFGLCKRARTPDLISMAQSKRCRLSPFIQPALAPAELILPPLVLSSPAGALDLHNMSVDYLTSRGDPA